MNKLLLALIFAVPLSAACPTGTAYPGALDTDATLTVAVNNLSTTLLAAMQITDTVAVVTNSTGWVVNTLATIDTAPSVEIVFVTAVNGNVLSISRGCENTLAVAHIAGAPFVQNVTAYGGHTSVAGAIKQIETLVKASPTAHSVPVAEGTSPFSYLAPGTSGLPIVSNGAAADPTYQTLPATGGGTGVASPSAHTVAVAEGSSPFNFIGPGTLGFALLSGGLSADPSYGVLGIPAGGTGQTTQTAALNAILGTSGVTGVQGSGDAKVQLAGTNSGLLAAPLCNDANGGTTTSGCGSLAFFNSSNYTFTGYTCNSSLVCSPGGTSAGTILSGGITLTFTPVPLGVNGTDLYHRLYFSGGTGAAEGCLITGGTGTSGQASGTIAVNCVNNHTSTYTIQSIDNGVQETVQAAETAGGGYVFVPPGTYTSFSALQIQSGIVLAGVVGQTIIKPGNQTITRNPQWQNPNSPAAGYYCAICVVTGSSNVVIRDLVVDENGANQTYSYIPGDILTYNGTNVRIENVLVQNRMTGGTGVAIGIYGHSPVTSNTSNVIIDSYVNAHPSGCTVPNGGGAYFIEGEGTRVISSGAINTCDTNYVVASCDHCSVIGSTSDLGAGQMGTPTFSVEGASDTIFSDDHCIATGTNSQRVCFDASNSNTIQTINTIFSSISCTHCFDLLDIGFDQANGLSTDTNPVLNTQIIGAHGDNITNGIVINQFAIKVTIDGLDVVSPSNAGLVITSKGTATVAPCPCVVQNVSVTNSKIDHGTTMGILITNATTGPPVTGFTLTSSFVGDTNATPVQPHAINIQTGTVNNVFIAGNTMTGNTGTALSISATIGPNVVIGPNITGDSVNLLTSYSLGAAVASAATITPTGPVFHVTGTTTISTINTPSFPGAMSSCITIIPDGLWATNTAGDIALATTAVVSKALTECLDTSTTKWYPSY